MAVLGRLGRCVGSRVVGIVGVMIVPCLPFCAGSYALVAGLVLVGSYRFFRGPASCHIVFSCFTVVTCVAGVFVLGSPCLRPGGFLKGTASATSLPSQAS